MSKAKKIVQKIIDDLVDRSGIGDEWDMIDGITKEKIKREWIKIVEEELKND